MTDSFLLGTVYRAHSVPRFSSPTALWRLAGLKAHPDPDREALHYFQSLADMEASELRECRADSEVSMMVSLSHSIYFHRPRDVCADEWMLSEMETPWAGDGRGLVNSRWWSRDGVLIATCVQEVGARSFGVVVGLFDADVVQGVMRLKDQTLNPREEKL